MTDEELLQWDQKGCIPGPNEREEDFLKRVDSPHAPSGETIGRGEWDWAKEQLEMLYGFTPDRFHAFYSDKNLAPWEGAACWIDDSGTPHLQLRNGFRKGSFLRLYTRDELLAHESVHAARAAFDEPENEEFFAYATSPKRWRRVLGPIIKRPREAWIVIGASVISLVAPPIFFIAITLLILGFSRLIRQHLRLRKAAAGIGEQVSDPMLVRKILLHLTDEEIRRLATKKRVQEDDSLRWRLIRLLYINGADKGR